MWCHLVKKRAFDYAENTLPDFLRKPFSAHLTACPECRQVVLDAERLLIGLAALPDISAPDELKESVMSHLPTRVSREAFPWVQNFTAWLEWIRTPLYIYVPATVVSLLLMAILVWPAMTRNPSQTVMNQYLQEQFLSVTRAESAAVTSVDESQSVNGYLADLVY